MHYRWSPRIGKWLSIKGTHLVQSGWSGRLFSFLCVGSFAALINVFCFFIIYYSIAQKINAFLAYMLAFLIATEISIVANFIPNDRITFRHLPGRFRSWPTRCLRFHLTSMSGTSITLVFSFTLFHLLHVLVFLAQAIALVAATAFNFTFHHLFTYRGGESHATAGNKDDPPSQSQQTDESQKGTIMKTLIIIPTYNEAENLPLLLEKTFSYAPQVDVLIIDDNSPDGTGELAEEIRRQDVRIHVLHRPGKLGLGTAYIAGFQYTIEQGYDVAFEMDADFSHDPRYLPDFLQAIERADVVIGSRYIPGGSTPNWSLIRRVISGSGNVFARFVLNIPVRDCTSGYRCYRRSVLQSLNLETIQSQGYAFQVELTYRVIQQGFKMIETPIMFVDRRLGKSKMSHTIFIEAFTYVLRTRLGNWFAASASTTLRSNS
jgi:dolichol-phosphate mannosyltransferase